MEKNIAVQGLLQDLHRNSIRVADISMSYLRDSGCVVLAQAIARNVSLERLHLQFCYIGDKGCAALAQALKENCTLKYLDL